MGLFASMLWGVSADEKVDVDPGLGAVPVTASLDVLFSIPRRGYYQLKSVPPLDEEEKGEHDEKVEFEHELGHWVPGTFSMTWGEIAPLLRAVTSFSELCLLRARVGDLFVSSVCGANPAPAGLAKAFGR